MSVQQPRPWSDTPLSTTPSRWRSLAGAAVMIVGAVLLGRGLLRSTEGLSQLSWQPSLGGTLLSLGSLAICLTFAPLMWRRLLVDFHHRLSYRDAFAIYYVSALAKYVPGSVWPYVGMAHYARRRDLSLGTTVFATLLQQAIVAGASLLVFAASLPFWPAAGWRHLLLAGAIWTTGAVVLVSPAPQRLLGMIAARMLRQAIHPQFTRTAMLVALLQLMTGWIFFTVGYHWLLQSLYPTSVKTTVVFTGIYAISWLAGFLVVVAPSGLGVRDGVQAYLLSLFVPPPVAVTIALGQRVWLTLGDLFSGLVAVWLLKRSD